MFLGFFDRAVFLENIEEKQMDTEKQMGAQNVAIYMGWVSLSEYHLKTGD